MTTSFSPGPSTIVYYIVAVPATIAIAILIYVGAGALCDILNPRDDVNVVLFFLELAAGVLVRFVQVSAPFLVFWPMLRLGRIVRAKEQNRRQSIRDGLAAAVHTPIDNLVTLRAPTGNRPYVLYLRPFSSTGETTILLKHKVKFHKVHKERPKVYGTVIWGDLETTIARAVEPAGRLVALGRPGEHIGAGRVLANDLRWKEEFTHLAGGASQIFVLPSTHAGTEWELAQLFSNPSLLRKTVLILPPKFSTYESRIYKSYRYDGFEEISEFQGGGPVVVPVVDKIHQGGRLPFVRFVRVIDEIHRDAISAMEKLRIILPYNSENGLFLRIGADRNVLLALPLWVPKESLIGSLWDWYLSQDAFTLSAAHIRRAIRRLSSRATH